MLEIPDGNMVGSDVCRVEELLRVFVEQAAFALAMFDRDMRYLCASRRWCSDFGLGERRLLGRSCYESLPEIPASWREAHRRGLAGEVLRSDEDRFERSDGSVQWLRWEIRPWRAAAGDIGGILIFTEDVTDRKATEGQLRSLALFPEENPMPVLRVSATGELVYANLAACRLLAPWGAVVGRPVPDFLQMQLGVAVMAGDRRELQISLDGRELSFTVVPIADQGYVNLYGRDLTERIQAERALRESENRYRELVEKANSAIIRWKADGTLTFFNEYAQRFFGYSAAEIIGRHVNMLVPDRESTGGDLSSLVRDIVAHPERFVSNVNENVCRDGRRVWMTWTNQPIFAADGRVSEILAIGSDITDRKRAEEALRESEERLRLALDAAYIISFEWNIQRNEVRRYLSHEAALAATAEGSPGTFEDVVAVVHPDDRELFKANVQAALFREDGSYENEFRIVRPDGGIAWLYERGRVKRNDAGQPVRLIGLSQDVSKRKQAEAVVEASKRAAEQASRAKSEFLATMSHEIRTPMTVFLMATEQLLQIESNPACRQLLEMADKSAKALRALVDDILDFSRIEARCVRLEQEPYDLHRCIVETVEMFRFAAREKRLGLTDNVAPDVPRFVIGDHARVQQILVNLIGNAVKFTLEGGVDVSVRRQGDRLEFAVADTGIGIPEEKRHLLFGSFSQVDSSFDRQYGGSGLGLAISKGLVELMGGSIMMQGRERGTVFTFTLPLVPQEDVPVAGAQPEADTEGASSGAHILLAEDDPLVRKVINLALARRGWHSEAAATGYETVEKWQRGSFDLILMDLQMPGLNGLEATRTIRGREAAGRERIPIIGITAHVGVEILKECHAAGMDLVLSKPLRMSDLYAAIERFRQASPAASP